VKEVNRILHGGDYNPNQWPEEEWQEDLSWFQKAHLNSVTLNVFSWAVLQPSEDEYDFSQLDRMIALYEHAGFDIVLATATAALPAWLVKRYPEVSRTDFEGRRQKFGKRHNACPNSLVYQHFARSLAGKLARRYGENPAVKLWHINNEYSGACFCENCEKAFRRWLRQRYKTPENLNAAWNTEFWSHKIYDWDEIVAPNRLSESQSKRDSAFEGMSVDYRRFNSDSLLNNFRMERDEIRRYDKTTPVTTNLMGTYKTLNYQRWGPEMDIVSWDNYPGDFDAPSMVALRHGVMRGLKAGKPFWIMEQNPTQQTYMGFTKKEPGKMRAWSYQALANGADALLYFQLKNSIGASEKYCGSVISHAGHKETRVFREVTQLGAELKKLGGQFLGAKVPAHVGIIYDWESYWALDYDRYRGTNKDLDYVETVHHHYAFFYQQHIPVDFISPQEDLTPYKLIVAPVLYMVGEALQKRLEAYVRQGGNLVVTYASGIVNESTNVIPGGYPGAFRELAGIIVEENDFLDTGMENRAQFAGKKVYPCEQTCDVIHLQGAQVIAQFADENYFYKGLPAVTVHEYGKGRVWYIGTRFRQSGLRTLLGDICGQSHIVPLVNRSTGLEITRRDTDKAAYFFLINHTAEPRPVPEEFVGCTNILTDMKIDKSLTLKKYDVLIIRQ